MELVSRMMDIKKDILLGAYIADIHFGAMDPLTQYQILVEQFITPISKIDNLDMVAICGDLFDHKAMANSDLIMYATKFIDDLINYIIRPKGCTLIIISGTYSHDAKQYKVLYGRLSDSSIDMRIVETIKFEYIKGHKILCIPELYNIDENIYKKYLFQSGWYDQVLMHGTIKGAVYGDNVGQGRLFSIEDFKYCTGPIISGHVHEPGCFKAYFYYCGSPYSWSFSDNDNKGFLIGLVDKSSRKHFIYKYRIESFRYEAINLDDIIDKSVEEIIAYIDYIKNERNIDYIRIDFNLDLSKDKKALLDQYYRDNNYVKFKYSYNEEQRRIDNTLKDNKYSQYDYLFDKTLSEYEILARYINEDTGSIFITAEEIKRFIEEEF